MDDQFASTNPETLYSVAEEASDCKNSLIESFVPRNRRIPFTNLGVLIPMLRLHLNLSLLISSIRLHHLPSPLSHLKCPLPLRPPQHHIPRNSWLRWSRTIR